MTLDEAAAIVDQLSTWFCKGTGDVPSARAMYDAIKKFNKKRKELGLREMPLPLGMKFSSYQLNKKTVCATAFIKDQTDAEIKSAAAAAAVDAVLGKAPPGRKKRL